MLLKSQSFILGFSLIPDFPHLSPEHILILQCFPSLPAAPPSPAPMPPLLWTIGPVFLQPYNHVSCAGIVHSLGFQPSICISHMAIGLAKQFRLGFHSMMQNEHKHICAQDVLNIKTPQKLWWVGFLSESQWTNQPLNSLIKPHIISVIIIRISHRFVSGSFVFSPFPCDWWLTSFLGWLVKSLSVTSEQAKWVAPL